jgi:endo-1,4-beta-xylanase
MQAKPKQLSRRQFGSALLGAGLSPALAPQAHAGHVCREPAPPVYQSNQPVVPLGAINPHVSWGVHLEGDAIYDMSVVEAIKQERPNIIAIGSGLKFGNLHPESIAFERETDGRKISTWSEADDIVRLASRLGASVRGDALIWNDWLPPWIEKLAKERPRGWRDQLQAAYEKNLEGVFSHFQTLDRQYGKSVMSWCGLINEPFAYWKVWFGKPAWRPGAWLDAFDPMPDGAPGYIHQAFRLAEKYGRSSAPALLVNEANCETDKHGPVLRSAMLALVDSLQAAGRKIDAVGLESHLQPEWMNDRDKPDWRPFVKFLQDLQSRGVAVYITELDVNDCALEDAAARDKLVADYTRSFVSAALEVPAVTMVTNWDFADSLSWYRDDATPESTFPALGRWPGCIARPACPRPTIYDQELSPKAARDALAAALAVKSDKK